MAVNFVYYKGDAKICSPMTDETQYRTTRNRPSNVERVQKARVGDDDAKRHLIQFNYSCYPGEDGGPLKGCKREANTVGMDVDLEKNDPDFEQKLAALPGTILAKKDDIHLLMLERSASKGFHIVFLRRDDLSQEENLKWAASVLGVKYDESAKDITRVFFTTTANSEDLLYLDPQIFDYQPSTRQPEAPAEVATPQAGQEVQAVEVAAEPAPVASEEEQLEYHGFTYPEIEQAYFDLYCDGVAPKEGDRHNVIWDMTVALRSACNNDINKIKQLVHCYNGYPKDEYEATVRDAMLQKTKGTPFRLNQVLKYLKDKVLQKAIGGSDTLPPALPKKLPALLKLISSHVLERYRPMICQGVFAALGAHLHDVFFKYADKQTFEPCFMCVCLAPTSSGKSFILKPVDHVMADIKARDDENRRREQQWKENNKAKGSNRNKDPRPKDICIQIMMPDVTNAAFVQRLIDCENNGHRFTFTAIGEITDFGKIQASGKGNTVSTLICTNFDHELYGQERVGIDSVSGTPTLRWNWVTSGNLDRGLPFMRPWINDGSLSRISLSTIILPDDNDDDEDDGIPEVGDYDDAFDKELKPYIDLLNAASGLIECPQAIKLAIDLDRESKSIAKHDYESEAYKQLSFRANRIAFYRAMVLYIANDYKWTKEIEDFTRWSLRYDLWCKMHFFGEELDEKIDNEHKINRHGPQNLLTALPKDFTEEDYKSMRVQLGKKDDNGSTLRSWIKRKHIVWDDVAQCYHKTKKAI